MQEVKLHFSGWILIVLILMILNWMGMEYIISSAIDRNTAAIQEHTQFEKLALCAYFKVSTDTCREINN